LEKRPPSPPSKETPRKKVKCASFSCELISDPSKLPQLNIRSKEDQKYNYVSFEKNCVLKGPYGTIKKFQNLEKFFDIIDLERIGINILRPIGYCKVGPKKFYVKYPIIYSNLGPWMKEQVCSPLGERHELCSPEQLGTIKYSAYIEEHQEEFETIHYPLILVTLTWFSILGIVDRSLDNILIVDGKLWFIDLDDHSHENTMGRQVDPFTFILNNRPKPPIQKMFESCFESHVKSSQDSLFWREIDIIDEHFGINKTEEISDETFEDAKTKFFDLADQLKIKRTLFSKVYTTIVTVVS